MRSSLPSVVMETRRGGVGADDRREECGLLRYGKVPRLNSPGYLVHDPSVDTSHCRLDDLLKKEGIKACDHQATDIRMV
jgi:hypothetical protein